MLNLMILAAGEVLLMLVLEVSARDEWRESEHEAGRLLGTCTRDM